LPKRKAAEWFKSHWKIFACWVCGPADQCQKRFKAGAQFETFSLINYQFNLMDCRGGLSKTPKK
jgi:hypothetical protein